MNDEERGTLKGWVGTSIIAVLFVILMLICGGCASYVIRDGEGKIVSQGEATGFLRTITVTEKLENGQVIERNISTESTAKDVLMGLNELIDTAADTAGRAF